MRRVVGVDIGSTSVRAVELKGSAIVKAAEQELPPGSVRRGEVLDVVAVAGAVKRLWSTAKFGSRDVVLGMGGPRVLSRDLAMPRGPIDRVRETLPFHVQDLIPVPVGEALLDFYPISEGVSAEGAPVINGLLIAAVKEAVQANVKSITRAGLSPVEVDLIPFALTRAMLPRTTGQGTVALISIGANSTNVVIATNGVPRFVRIIPSGGDDITAAIASQLDLSVNQAEVAKRELGFGSMTTRAEHRPIVELIFKVAGEQLNALRNTIGYYVNASEGTTPNRIVISGGGSYLPGLQKALEDLTGIPVSRAAAPQIAARGRASGNDFDRFTTAHALALVTA